MKNMSGNQNVVLDIKVDALFRVMHDGRIH
jgi:hypothetical protein